MNENYQPVAPVIKDWLKSATQELKEVGIDSARLDAEIILAHTLKKGRTHLHSHDDEILDSRSLEIADARLVLRLEYVPIAYIIGHKEFYGRKFKVTTATLIPRPESEVIIDLLKEFLPEKTLFTNNFRLVDVGTGCGCLGVTAKLEVPDLDVTLLDISSQALLIAKQNADLLNAKVDIQKSDLFSNYFLKSDIIVANLPYVDRSWERSPSTDHEPDLALFAEQGGLALIYKLITQSLTTLSPGGLILLESDPEQHDNIIKFALKNKLLLIKQRGFCLAFRRD